MRIPEECPKCRANLIGDPIPEEDREVFGGSTHFIRTIGLEDPAIYDGVYAWKCPDCGYEWMRFDFAGLNGGAFCN
jgi:hypothetical protein